MSSPGGRSAGAAGLLLRGQSAEGDGDAVLQYDWGTNLLELRFGAAHLLPAEVAAEGGWASATQLCPLLLCAALLHYQLLCCALLRSCVLNWERLLG